MYNIIITGDLESGDRRDITIEDLDNLSAQLVINEDGDRPTHHCANCGEEDPDNEEPCEGSGEWGPCPVDHDSLDGEECDQCDGNGEIEIHDIEAIPLHWINSASIHARPDRDKIQVTISVGDPRGAFVMSVERRDDGLYLSVPHAGMGMPHMDLTERSAGWFKIGH